MKTQIQVPVKINRISQHLTDPKDRALEELRESLMFQEYENSREIANRAHQHGATRNEIQEIINNYARFEDQRSI